MILTLLLTRCGIELTIVLPMSGKLVFTHQLLKSLSRLNLLMKNTAILEFILPSLVKATLVLLILTDANANTIDATGATLRSGTGGVGGDTLTPKQNKFARSQTNQGSLRSRLLL